MNDWIGYAIAILAAVVSAAAVLVQWITWKRRWDVNRYGGVLVRFVEVEPTAEIGEAIATACDALRHVALNRWPDQVGRMTGFRVEVVRPGYISTPSVPAGHLPSGELVGGSVRSERCFPWTRKHWVAVVTTERMTSFLVHEVVCHVWSQLHGRGHNLNHSDSELAALEEQGKALIAPGVTLP